MSRSRRKTPMFGITTAMSERQDKRLANRRLRRIARQAVNQGKEAPLLREVSDVYDFAKDGRRWLFGPWFKGERGSAWAKRMMQK